MSTLSPPHAAGVGAAGGMFTCAVSPSGYFGPGSGRERSRGVTPSRFRILGGAELGREEQGPPGEGTGRSLWGKSSGWESGGAGARESEERFGVFPSSTWLGS